MSAPDFLVEKKNRMKDFIRRYQLHFYSKDNEKNKSAIKYKIQFFEKERKLFISYHLNLILFIHKFICIVHEMGIICNNLNQCQFIAKEHKIQNKFKYIILHLKGNFLWQKNFLEFWVNLWYSYLICNSK